MRCSSNVASALAFSMSKRSDAAKAIATRREKVACVKESLVVPPTVELKSLLLELKEFTLVPAIQVKNVHEAPARKGRAGTVPVEPHQKAQHASEVSSRTTFRRGGTRRGLHLHQGKGNSARKTLLSPCQDSVQAHKRE